MKVYIALLALFAIVSSAVAIKNAVCGLAHSQNGDGIRSCMAFIPSWSYKSDTNECVPFTYGGCGGNDNRFFSQSDCETTCKEKKVLRVGYVPIYEVLQPL